MKKLSDILRVLAVIMIIILIVLGVLWFPIFHPCDKFDWISIKDIPTRCIK